MQKKRDDRERSRERKARRNRKYGQAKRKHAKRGIISTVTAAAAGCMLAAVVAAACKSGGREGSYAGGIGIVCAFLSGVGTYSGFRGFREREKNYLTCKIGIACNILFLTGLLGIFCRGLFL